MAAKGSPDTATAAITPRLHAPASADPPYEPYLGSRELFLATDGDGVYHSTNAGRTWSPVPDSFRAVQVTAMTFLPGTTPTVLAGTQTAGLYRSQDGGRTWSFADTGLPRGAGQAVRALRVSPAFEADRTSSRFTFGPSSPRAQRSRPNAPSHGLGPLQYPSGASLIFVAAARSFDFPHSQRTTTSVRSPVVPRSSSHSSRRHLSSLP